MYYTFIFSVPISTDTHQSTPAKLLTCWTQFVSFDLGKYKIRFGWRSIYFQIDLSGILTFWHFKRRIKFLKILAFQIWEKDELWKSSSWDYLLIRFWMLLIFFPQQLKNSYSHDSGYSVIVAIEWRK